MTSHLIIVTSWVSKIDDAMTLWLQCNNNVAQMFHQCNNMILIVWHHVCQINWWCHNKWDFNFPNKTFCDVIYFKLKIINIYLGYIFVSRTNVKGHIPRYASVYWYKTQYALVWYCMEKVAIHSLVWYNDLTTQMHGYEMENRFVPLKFCRLSTCLKIRQRKRTHNFDANAVSWNKDSIKTYNLYH